MKILHPIVNLSWHGPQTLNFSIRLLPSNYFNFNCLFWQNARHRKPLQWQRSLFRKQGSRLRRRRGGRPMAFFIIFKMATPHVVGGAVRAAIASIPARPRPEAI